MDGADREALILANAAWARRLALQAIRRRRVDPDEAIAAGNLALVEAAGRYVPGGAASFRTFAHRRVVGAVLDLAHGRSDVPLDDVADELVDPAPGPHRLAEAAEARRLAAALLPLATPRERAALEAVYLEGLTLAEVAERLGISAARVCQLVAAGVERLGRAAVRASR